MICQPRLHPVLLRRIPRPRRVQRRVELVRRAGGQDRATVGQARSQDGRQPS